MLQSNLHDAIRVLRRCEALLSFGDRPGHGLFAVEIFAGFESVAEMLSVQMQRRSDNNGVDVFRIEQAAMIVIRLNATGHFFGFIAAAVVNIGDCDQFGVANLLKFLEKVLAASAETDHPHPHAIVGAEHTCIGKSK